MSALIDPKDLAKVQYHGDYGITRNCLNAIIRLIHFGNKVEEAKLLTCGNYHCFLLSVATERDYIMIKSGFASGYSGEGPRGLATALQLLEWQVDWIEEYNISSTIFQRINDSCLLISDLDEINSAKPVTPYRLYEYKVGYKLTDNADNNRRLRDEFPRIIPLRIIDCRILDLADKFEEHPDSALMSAYRRLEDTIRKRAGLNNDLIGAKLFAKVFQGDNSILYWENVEPAEREGRVSLFKGVYLAFRNRRAHRELCTDLVEGIREFLLLNELFLLESKAIARSKDTE